MSTATHYPESGFKCGYNWHQTTLLLSDEPGTLANWQSFTALDGTDLTNLGTDNASGVSTECYFVGGETSYTYAGGVAGRFTLADGTNSQFDITIKAVDNGGTGYHFWVYNFNTGAFSAIGSHTGSFPQTFTFTYSISTNPSYYLDGSSRFWLLCCTDEYDSAAAAKLTVFMKVVNTYTAGGTIYSFSPNSVSHSQSVGVGGLTQVHILTPNVVSQGQPISAGGLTQLHHLTPDDVLSVQTVGTGALGQTHSLVPDSVLQVQSMASGQVVYYLLAPDGVTQVQSLGSPVPTGLHILAPDTVKHTQTVSAGVLSVVFWLEPDDVLILQTVGQGDVLLWTRTPAILALPLVSAVAEAPGVQAKVTLPLVIAQVDA